jgi:cell division protein FtsI (penicillin-binding protein 3)
MLLLLLCGFSVILIRLVTLKCFKRRTHGQGRSATSKTVSFEGQSMVSDRHGKVFAMNVEVPSVFGVPTSLEAVDRRPSSFFGAPYSKR